MTTAKVNSPIPWILLSVLVSIVGLTGCRSEKVAREVEPKPITAARAQYVLAHEGPSGEGPLPGGRFRFGSPFDSSEMQAGGRLASASWDVYWHRSDGNRGAWGVGIDVLRTPERAARALDEEAAFWCPGQRRGIEGVATGDLADVRASSCRRADGEGFYATLDAADGPVLASLTLAGSTRREAVAALRAVWPAIRDALVRVRTSLGCCVPFGASLRTPPVKRHRPPAGPEDVMRSVAREPLFA